METILQTMGRGLRRILSPAPPDPDWLQARAAALQFSTTASHSMFVLTPAQISRLASECFKSIKLVRRFAAQEGFPADQQIELLVTPGTKSRTNTGGSLWHVKVRAPVKFPGTSTGSYVEASQLFTSDNHSLWSDFIRASRG